MYLPTITFVYIRNSKNILNQKLSLEKKNIIELWIRTLNKIGEMKF